MSQKTKPEPTSSTLSLESEVATLKMKLQEQQLSFNDCRNANQALHARCNTLEAEKHDLSRALNEKENQVKLFSSELTKIQAKVAQLEAQLFAVNKEKDHRSFVDSNTLRIPLIFNDENSQYDGVLKQMNEIGEKQLVQFYETVPGMIAQGAPFVLYLCNVASRFHEDMNKEKRDFVGSVARMVRNIAIRFSMNPKAMMPLTDDAIHYQFLYDGTKLLDIADNKQYLENIVKDIRSFKPLPAAKLF